MYWLCCPMSNACTAQSLQSCLTLCDPMDYSPPGSSVPGILQTRILEQIAMPSSRGSSWTRDQTCVSCIAGGFFIIWATRDAHPLSHRRCKSTLHKNSIILMALKSLATLEWPHLNLTCSYYISQPTVTPWFYISEGTSVLWASQLTNKKKTFSWIWPSSSVASFITWGLSSPTWGINFGKLIIQLHMTFIFN